jgi:hypothetical protein
MELARARAWTAAFAFMVALVARLPGVAEPVTT